MPSATYWHRCPARGSAPNVGPGGCRECDEPNRFHEWSWSPAEEETRYRRRTGLNPRGPLPPALAGRPLAEPCRACDGRGLFDIGSGRSYALCDACDSAGGFPALDRAIIDWANRWMGEALSIELGALGTLPVLSAPSAGRPYSKEGNR